MCLFTPGTIFRSVIPPAIYHYLLPFKFHLDLVFALRPSACRNSGGYLEPAGLSSTTSSSWVSDCRRIRRYHGREFLGVGPPSNEFAAGTSVADGHDPVHLRDICLSCVTITMVTPRALFSSRKTSSIVAAVLLSTHPVGSSASSSFGSLARAMAMATLCCSPPGWLSLLFRLFSNPTRSLRCSAGSACCSSR